MRRWVIVAVICLTAAVQQWIELVGRLSQLVNYSWKFGVQERSIDTSVFMVVVFFVATALFVVLGLVAADRLRRRGSPFRLGAELAVQA